MGSYFISYSTRDGEDHAFRLYNSLLAGPPPLTPWLSRGDMRVGNWAQQIERAIKDCTALLVASDLIPPRAGCACG